MLFTGPQTLILSIMVLTACVNDGYSINTGFVTIKTHKTAPKTLGFAPNVRQIAKGMPKL